ncbi:MAG: hypothetical protein A2Y77_09550, partial [Planctomycetes bacterium RBG_13_62_9]
MYTRLVILSVIVLSALCALGALGYHAIDKWAQGLEGTRLGEFAEVAEQIRQDVKRKLDEFIAAEQQRKYTDYLYYYVPENLADTGQQLPLLRSPLGGQLSNSFAYGYFQIEPDGNIITPYYQGRSPPASEREQDKLVLDARRQTMNIWQNVLPSLNSGTGAPGLRYDVNRSLEEAQGQPPALAKEISDGQANEKAEPVKSKAARGGAYPIESLNQEAQEAQVFTQQRAIATSNWTQAPPPALRERMQATAVPAPQTPAPDTPPPGPGDLRQAVASSVMPQRQAERPTVADASSYGQQQAELLPPPPVPQKDDASEMVQICIEPFVPLVVPDVGRTASIFGGQVFLLRHVQIEAKHFLQGFQLDEQKLITEVGESARRFMRDGMDFALPQSPSAKGATDFARQEPAYTANLDFGFGNLILSLREIDPGWIAKRISGLHRIYFGIIAIVVVAVALALASLWHNVRAEVILAQKKDDFISAVSHELRTPLTSIRMYAEMLEKNWVKSADKLTEYYRTMGQESERLSRLVENVLDFARLQKGRKRYAFELGGINDAIMKVVEMMRPYAEQHGFAIRAQLGQVGETSFDKDAVTQIVVNL